MKQTLRRMTTLALCLVMLLTLLPTTSRAADGWISWSLGTVDGRTITDQTYAKKTQVLIFYRAQMSDGSALCYNSSNTISTLADAYWLNNKDVQVIAVAANDGSTKAEAETFRNAYGASLSNVVFAYGGRDLMWDYWGWGSLSYCMCVILKDGAVQDMWSGNSSLTTLTSHLSAVADLGKDPSKARTKVEGRYCQTEARSMLPMINDFRTGGEAWYWNSDDETKTTFPAGQLGELTYDYDLEKIAMQRAAEIALFFAHTRPDGSRCFDLTVNGTSSWGENIAAGYTSAKSVFIGWREDDDPYSGQGHRRNMLKDGFTTVGIGCFYSDGCYYWVQEFGYDQSGAAATTANNGSATLTITYDKKLVPYATPIPEAEAGWQKNSTGWWYRNEDGSYPKNQWQQIKGKWYHFDKKGYMQTGWLQLGGKWYYLDSSGAMVTGWKSIGSKWYYFNASGVMQTGWQKISSKWYYFNTSGVMQTGWQKISEKWYYFNTSGVMQTGWLKLSGKWYYLESSGVMHTGWLQLKDKWYFFNGSGVMLTGKQVINGKTQLFDDNGVWLGRQN